MTSPAGTASGPTSLSRGAIRKVALASLIGTTIEWYDFFIYGVAATLVFNQLFFPAVAPSVGTLVSVATIGVAFVARPVGGIVFGHIGDRVGRKTTLIWTLLIAGIATTLVGFLPTYDTIGIAAPILLVVIRFLQGIGLAGEWGGAVLMAAEHAPSNRRGFYAGWPQVGVALGVFLANGVFLLLDAVLSDEQFLAWGWRIPFLASVVLIGVGLFIRLHVMESPVFTQLESSGSRAKAPLLDVVRTRPGTLALATLALLLNLVAFYVLMTFMVSYTTSTLSLPRNAILGAVLVSAVVLAVGTLLASSASDRFGRRPVIVAFYACWVVFAFPLFWLVNSRMLVLVFVAMSVGMFLTSAYGPIAAFLAELFPPETRYSGMSLSFQVASVLGGGLAPIGALALADAGLGYAGVAMLLVATAVVSIVAMLAVPVPDGRTFAFSPGRGTSRAGDEARER